MKRWYWLPLAVLMMSPAAAVAQEEAESPTWWAVFTEKVAPENVAAFEKNSAEMIEVIREHAPEGMVYYTMSGPEMGFSYAIPMESIADFGKMNDMWMSMVNEIGWEEWKSMQASDLVEHYTMNFYVERRDLSYMPEALESAMPERPVRHMDWLYPKSGMEEEFEAAMKEWVEMYADHGLETGWIAFQAVSGENLPMYVLMTPAETTSGYYAMSAEVDEMLGEEGQMLMQKSMALMRDFEHNEGFARPELSLLPDEM